LLSGEPERAGELAIVGVYMCGECPRCFGTNLETSTWQVEKKNITKHRHKYIQIHHISPYHRPSKISITTSQALITPSHSQALPLLDELQGLAAKRVEATTQEARQVLHVRPGPRWLPGKAVWILTDIGRYWIPWILLDFNGFEKSWELEA